MKILIGYPPLKSEKGVALLSQNRQFQWFSNPSYLFPVVLGSAATLLKEKGHEVIWLDCVAENVSYEEFIRAIENEKPELFAFETKTPVIKQHWKIIDELKEKFPEMKIVILGDHVTSFPEESLEKSNVDFVSCGGDFDFSLSSLCDWLSGKEKKLEGGVYYKKNKKIISSGKFHLNHNLNELPFVDRELTKWKLYQKEYNLQGKPFFYIMSGRDCWWGKCKFCLEPSMEIITDKGVFTIKEIVKENLEKINVMTHKGNFELVDHKFERDYTGKIMDIELFCLKERLKLTPNHKIIALKKQLRNKYPEFIETEKLEKGDFVAVPITREVKDLDYLNVKEILSQDSIFAKTLKKKSEKIVDKIIELSNKKYSKRSIAKILGIDRETVSRYLKLEKTNSITTSLKKIIEEDGEIKYDYGKRWIPRTIKLSKDFMRLIGYYLAEGHSTLSTNRPNSYVMALTFSEKEEEYIADVINLLNNISPKLSISKAYNKNNHTIQITIFNSVLALMFKRLFGENCYNKRIPEDFMLLPLDKQKELLKGLFRGDGHLRIRNTGEGGSEYIYYTTSKQLASQVTRLLFRNESIPRVRKIMPRGKAKVPQYSISLCQQDIKRIFPTIVLPKRKDKNRHGFILDNYAMVEIKTISYEKYSGKVYNLSVKNDHSYTANNVIVSNCAWPTLFPAFRVRKVENVLDEIGMLIEKYNAKEIFDDSGTLMIGNWLKDLCNGLIKRGYNKKIKYSCNMRFNALNQEDFDLMKKAGFRLLKFGLESANQKTLDKLNKGIRVEDILNGCEMAKKAGLTLHLTMIVGYPWETKEDALRTFELAKELMQKGKADLLQATVLVPYPGTPLWREARENNWFLFPPEEYERYDMREPVLKTENSDARLPQTQSDSAVNRAKEIAGICGKIYTIFLTPSYILQRAKNMRSWNDFKFNLRGIKAVFGHLKDFWSK